MRNRTWPHPIAVAVGLQLLLACAEGARLLAGPVPLPPEVTLDLAEHVVVGELTQMQDANVPRSDGVRWGTATVTVRETLKGQEAPTLSFGGASWVAPDYGGSSPPRVYRKGDSGIWLIMPAGTDEPAVLLDAARRTEVVRRLTWLQARKWSAPVNGLQAWAGAVQPDKHPTPVVVFAVKNVSAADIHYPVEREPGVVSASAVGPAQTVFTLPPVPRQPDGLVYCRKIGPGATVYLHPDYSFLDLAAKLKLPPAEYAVTVTYRNERDGQTATGPAQRVPVHAWKGELQAPPVQLSLSNQARQE